MYNTNKPNLLISEGKDELVSDLKKHIEQFASRDEAARSFGVSRNYLWQVINGNALPNKAMCDILGYKHSRIITNKYEKA